MRSGDSGGGASAPCVSAGISGFCPFQGETFRQRGMAASALTEHQGNTCKAPRTVSVVSIIITRDHLEEWMLETLQQNLPHL